MKKGIKIESYYKLFRRGSQEAGKESRGEMRKILPKRGRKRELCSVHCAGRAKNVTIKPYLPAAEGRRSRASAAGARGAEGSADPESKNRTRCV